MGTTESKQWCYKAEAIDQRNQGLIQYVDAAREDGKLFGIALYENADGSLTLALSGDEGVKVTIEHPGTAVSHRFRPGRLDSCEETTVVFED